MFVTSHNSIYTL